MGKFDDRADDIKAEMVERQARAMANEALLDPSADETLFNEAFMEVVSTVDLDIIRSLLFSYGGQRQFVELVQQYLEAYYMSELSAYIPYKEDVL